MTSRQFLNSTEDWGAAESSSKNILIREKLTEELGLVSTAVWQPFHQQSQKIFIYIYKGVERNYIDIFVFIMTIDVLCHFWYIYHRSCINMDILVVWRVPRLNIKIWGASSNISFGCVLESNLRYERRFGLNTIRYNPVGMVSTSSSMVAGYIRSRLLLLSPPEHWCRIEFNVHCGSSRWQRFIYVELNELEWTAFVCENPPVFCLIYQRYNWFLIIMTFDIRLWHNLNGLKKCFR